ncbi:MAG: hypothetical protein EPN26_15245 [Rhodospirillales bacterium]|nr:MAG: hypothetical protein EPN26_15245 [Rhodospirillales bacterium]
MADDMELKDFISSSLVQIVEGVQAALDAVGNNHTSGAKINPMVAHGAHTNPKDVEFDIAVTVTGGANLNGKVGIKIASFQVGGGGEKKSETQAVSRIKFAVPVSVPCTRADQYPDTTRVMSLSRSSDF